MKRVACLTPLPPVKSGIASYSLMLFRELAKICDLTAVVAQEEIGESGGVEVMRFDDFVQRRGEFDAVFCQVGNNPHHEVVYRYALEHPSVVVLHDLVLHHLIVEMTLARGDIDGYVEALTRNHGEAGAAWARGRAAGLHDEIGNFLFPSSIDLAQRSLHVIVHNSYARDVLIRHGVTTPITVTGHPMPSIDDASVDRNALRSLLGYREDNIVVAMFGFVTAAKRPEVVLRAFAEASRRRRELRLLIVGEPAPNIELQQLARDAGIEPEFWKATGYVADDDFVRYLSAVDRVVNLRYPSAGETSGALIHVLAAGRPIAVSDYGPFADLPDALVAKVPLGDGEIDALVSFMLAAGNDDQGAARKEWAERTCNTASIAADYMNAAGVSARLEAPERGLATIPIFIRWQVEQLSVVQGHGVARLRNRSEVTIHNPLYGEPAARVIAKFQLDDGSIADRWLRPDGDVLSGGIVTLHFAVPAGTQRITLTHALEGVEMIDSLPFAALDLV